MSSIVRELKSVITIKLKKDRSDSLSDQFHRIFMVKIMLICSICTGINWYKDSLHCISSKGVSSSFATDACWIQGVYIYEELKGRIDEVAYYGIPKDIDSNGIRENGNLCNTYKKKPRTLMSENCVPLTKTFFLQYQWLPFYISVLALLYYTPYIIHLYVNQDIISLKKSIVGGGADPEKIVTAYFDRKRNPLGLHSWRILCNYVIKCAYISVNYVAMLSTDKLLNGKFGPYGRKWMNWNRLENNIAYDYMGARDHPKPGHELLPPFGYCELYESAQDLKASYVNHHKFVCEVSQNILNQYTLVIIWCSITISTLVSFAGLICLLGKQFGAFLCVYRKHGSAMLKLYAKLSLRECEYLEFIRKNDIAFYGEVLQKLEEKILGERLGKVESGSLPCDTPPPGFEEATKDYHT